MADGTQSFAELLHPIRPEAFFAEYHHRKMLHIPGPRDKFAALMSWDILNRLLNMGVWSNNSLQLVMDQQRVPPGAYCVPTLDRNRSQVMQPDPDKVMDLVRNGASLLLNEIETLHPAVLAVVRALESTLGAKSSANLYCSWQDRQAFDSHYDRHDVYALHVYGEKRWRIYEGRADNPIEHPVFQNVPQADYDRMKGAVAQEVVMGPGDLLYLPRGQFHDALASDKASIHVTFSCSEPTGLDWLTAMWNGAVGDSLFRAEMPRPDDATGDTALLAHVSRLVDRLKEIAESPSGIQGAMAARRSFAPKRGSYHLPTFETPASYSVHAADLKVVRRGKDWLLLGPGLKLPLSAKERRLVTWITRSKTFQYDELAAAFPDLDRSDVADTLAKLVSQNIVTEL